MISRAYGIDPGSYMVKLCDLKENRIWTRETVVALSSKGKMLACGSDGVQKSLDSPECVSLSYPVQNGKVADLLRLQYLLRQSLPIKRCGLGGGVHIFLTVPPKQTESEKSTLAGLFPQSIIRFGGLHFVERAVADACGCHLVPEKEKGLAVLNLGAHTAELSILSCGELIAGSVCPSGKEAFLQAVENAVRTIHGIRIGKEQADILLQTFGISDTGAGASLIVQGADLQTGRPVRQPVFCGTVKEAAASVMAVLLEEFATLFSRIPPEILKSIPDSGMCLAGGFAGLRGLVPFLQKETGLFVHLAEEPALAAVYGMIKMQKSILECSIK